MSILLIFFCVSCASVRSHPEPTQSSVYHMVICWLKEPGNQSHRDKLLDETMKLRAIPGILSVEAGTMLPGNRSIVDSSFDLGIIMHFKDEKAMRAYLHDPRHRKATREVLAPLTSKVIVYDFVKSR